MRKFGWIGVALFSPLAARADVIWPALFLAERRWSVWVIVLGLLIEALLLWRAFALPARRALWASLVINTVSLLLGTVLIPTVSFLWEAMPGRLIYALLGAGTFSPVSWLGSTLVISFINTVLEGPVLRRFFGVPFTRRTVCWLMLANLCSVGLALLSIVLWYPADLS